jgi:hypothetical protein
MDPTNVEEIDSRAVNQEKHQDRELEKKEIPSYVKIFRRSRFWHSDELAGANLPGVF